MNTYTPLKEWASKTSLRTGKVQTLSHILFHYATQKLEKLLCLKHYVCGKLVFNLNRKTHAKFTHSKRQETLHGTNPN
jgi:SET domain-containing protein